LSNWVIAHNDVEERGIAKNTTEIVSQLSQRDANEKVISAKTPISLIHNIFVQFGAENLGKFGVSLVSICKGMQKQDLKES
jgi:hypothetical protein